LVFKNGVYIGHIEYTTQKYEEPDFVFLEDNIFSIKYLDESGSGMLGYRTDVYKIDDKNWAKKILNYMNQYEREGWRAPDDIYINSKSSYSHGQLKLKYQIKVTQGKESEVKGGLSGTPIVQDERTVIYKLVNNGFMVDTKLSDLKPEVLDNFDAYTKSLYLMYKSEFDRLKRGSKENRQWYDYFIKSVK
jgi:hypothetical protein